MKKGHRVRRYRNGRKRLAFECFCGLLADAHAAGLCSYQTAVSEGGIRKKIAKMYTDSTDKNRQAWMDGFRG